MRGGGAAGSRHRIPTPAARAFLRDCEKYNEAALAAAALHAAADSMTAAALTLVEPRSHTGAKYLTLLDINVYIGLRGMDEIIRKVRVGDKDLDAVEMSYQEGGEHWNEYVLRDGSVIRLKPVVTQILKVVDLFDAEGNPVYVVKSANVVAVSASDRARKPPSPPPPAGQK